MPCEGGAGQMVSVETRCHSEQTKNVGLLRSRRRMELEPRANVSANAKKKGKDHRFFTPPRMTRNWNSFVRQRLVEIEQQQRGRSVCGEVGRGQRRVRL